MDYKTEALFKIYSDIMDQIKFSDTKTGLLMASTGIIFGILFDIFKHIEYTSYSFTQQSLTLISLFCNTISLIIYIVSVFPRKGSDTNTIFFWGKLCTYKNGEYNKIISNLNEADIVEDLSNQVCILSKICDEKMSHFKYGTFMLTLTIISIGLLYFSIYLY